MKTNNKRRQSVKILASLGLGAVAMPARWHAPLINSIVLPAHAQTSFDANCSGFETEPVNEPISLTVTATEVRGPIVIARTGTTFSGMATNNVGRCMNDTQDRTQVTELTGTINSAQNSITGTFIVRQFCGDSLACEQVTDYTVTQTVAVVGDDSGEYTGRTIGTLRCCIDFL